MKPRTCIEFAFHGRSVVLGIILLGIFALYSGALRQALIYDDPVNITALATRNIISLFDLHPYGTGNYRPMSFLPWLFMRDWFGWFIPSLLHAWNVWSHVLNTALIASLAWRLGRRFGMRSTLLAVLCGLRFGLFPFSYQAILFAGALPHPFMVAFGLAAVHAYLTARGPGSKVHLPHTVLWLVCILMLLASLLSHEQGFVFGVFILFADVMIAWSQRKRLSAGAFAACGIALAYAVFYRLFMQTYWTDTSNWATGPMGLSEILANFGYQAQGLVYGWLVALRDYIGLPENGQILVLVMLGATAVLTVISFVRMRLLTLGVITAGWWLVAVAPSVLLTSPNYLQVSPRLMYVPSIGASLLLGMLLVAWVRLVRRPLFQGVIIAASLILLAWCAGYIADRSTESDHLAVAFNQIDADLQHSDPSAQVLLINLPWWSIPARPTFPIGVESMPIYLEGAMSPSDYLGTVSNTRRQTAHIRHDISLTHGDRYMYGIVGVPRDDAALRDAILKSNYIFRFDYDDPWLRARRLAIVTLDQGDDVVARLSDGKARVILRAASARACENRLRLDLIWADVDSAGESLGVFVHVLDKQGAQVLAADRDLLEGYLPLDQVPDKTKVAETREIVLPQQVGEGSFDGLAVSVGVYNRADVKRLAAVRQNGSMWEGDAITVPVRVESCQMPFN
ncbi:MAG: hypothetical protein M1546_03965 [Chloroflexi bacterium]|nr:hypothetical protein [Chloroflexota bacterium]